MMRRIKLVCLLFFVLLVVGWGLRMTPNPLQTPATALRKNLLQTFVTCPSFTAAILALGSKATADEVKKKFEYMPALQGLDYGKPRTVYPDFVQKPSGLQYKIAKEGAGKTPKKGDRVVVDWEGYTIGYYGRPFQTRNKE